MLVRAPLMEAEQHSSIRIEDLTKVVMAGSCLGLAEERLVPFEASRHIAYADDRPGAFHDISPVGLMVELIPLGKVLLSQWGVSKHHSPHFILHPSSLLNAAADTCAKIAPAQATT